MADPLAALSADLQALVRALDGPPMDRLLTDLGVAAKKDVTAAIRGDLGDESMSNWRRGRPIQLSSRFDVDGRTVTVVPTPRAVGPMKVLEEGRRAGTSRGRRGRAPRRYGATAGKRTWSDAERLIDAHTPKLVEEGVVKIVREIIGG